jgi:hypothetical protein
MWSELNSTTTAGTMTTTTTKIIKASLTLKLQAKVQFNEIYFRSAAF